MSHFNILRTTVLIAVTSTVLFGAAYADDALKMDLSANKVIINLIVTLPIPHKMIFTGNAYPVSAQERIDGKAAKITLSKYRTLRWNIKLLLANKSAAVTLNTTVS